MNNKKPFSDLSNCVFDLDDDPPENDLTDCVIDTGWEISEKDYEKELLDEEDGDFIEFLKKTKESLEKIDEDDIIDDLDVVMREDSEMPDDDEEG
jgi:hypothetical protein